MSDKAVMSTVDPHAIDRRAKAPVVGAYGLPIMTIVGIGHEFGKDRMRVPNERHSFCVQTTGLGTRSRAEAASHCLHNRTLSTLSV